TCILTCAAHGSKVPYLALSPSSKVPCTKLPAVSSAAGNHSVLGTQPKFWCVTMALQSNSVGFPIEFLMEVRVFEGSKVPCIKTVAIGSAAGNHSVLGTQPEFWCITVALQTNCWKSFRTRHSAPVLAHNDGIANQLSCIPNRVFDGSKVLHTKMPAVGLAAGNHSVLSTQPKFWCITTTTIDV
ncbi:hypothetical protein PSTT_14454, partial [Puccinia striiformis]